MAYETRRRKGVGAQTSGETQPEKSPVQRSKKAARLAEEQALLQAKADAKDEKKLLTQEPPKETSQAASEQAPQALFSRSPKAGEKETREQIKDGEALMKRPTESRSESALVKLSGPLAALTDFPPEYFEALQLLDKMLQKGVSRTEFVKATQEHIPDTHLQAELMKVALPYLKGGNPAAHAAPSATASTPPASAA